MGLLVYNLSASNWRQILVRSYSWWPLPLFFNDEGMDMKNKQPLSLTRRLDQLHRSAALFGVFVCDPIYRMLELR